MSYLDEYDVLLTKDGYDKIKVMVDNKTIISEYEPVEFTLRVHDGLKYFSLIIDTKGKNVNFSSYLLVSYQEKKDLFPYANDNAIFPVMFIVSPSELEKKTERFHNKTITLAHELMHLKDLMHIFDQEPSFIEKALKNSLSNISDFTTIKPERLAECIDFAVEKIFRIEPQAVKADFEAGDHIIILPFDSDFIIHECGIVSDYIKMKLFLDAYEIKVDIQDKIKSDEKLLAVLSTSFSDSISRHGKEVFGKNAYKNFEATGKQLVMIIFQHAQRKC